MFSFTTPSFQQPIQGQLPFGRGGGGSIGGSPQAIASSYQSAYNNALSMNQANYNNVLQGYQSAVAAQTSAQAAIGAGYNDLYNQVLAKLQGQGDATAHRINDASAQFLAAQTQRNTDLGLGNSTITTSTARGVEADRQQRLQENDESVAKMMADYMSNLGTRRLEGARQGQQSITGLALNQLDFMNSVQAKYPDAGMYMQLAQQAAEANRGYGAGGGLYGGGSFGGVGGASPKVGYVPGGGPYYGSGGYSPPPAAAGGSFNAFAGGFGGGGSSYDTPSYGGSTGAGNYGYGGMDKLPVDYSGFASGAGRSTFGGGGSYGTTTPVDYGYGADPSLWGA